MYEGLTLTKTQLTALIWEENKSFVSKCPELEVASAGDTPQEALANLKEAVELWLKNAKVLGILEDFSTIIKSPQKFTSTIEIEI